MRLSFDLTCPRCGGEPTPGPAESFGGVITRRALACECGWIAVATTTLVTKSCRRDLDHLEAV